MDSPSAQTPELCPPSEIRIGAPIRIGAANLIPAAGCVAQVALGSGVIRELAISSVAPLGPDDEAAARLLELSAPNRTFEDLIGLLPVGGWTLRLAIDLRRAFQARVKEMQAQEEPTLASEEEVGAEPRYAFELDPDRLKWLADLATEPEEIRSSDALVAGYARLIAAAGMLRATITETGMSAAALDRLAGSALGAGEALARRLIEGEGSQNAEAPPSAQQS